MKTFLEAHASKIQGTLSCFDRMLFRGYLPLESGGFMADFLRSQGVRAGQLKVFLPSQADRLVEHAKQTAAVAGRPYEYLRASIKMEDAARAMAEQKRIESGLVCVFSVLEACRTFSLKWKEQMPVITPAKRKCLFLYYYFMDRDLGLMHVKIQTWFPFRIQIYVNGHDWLARKLERSGVEFVKADNVFLRIADLPRAQAFSDRFTSLPWVRLLSGYARRVNPLLGKLLKPMEYYWCTAQAEYSADILFKGREPLAELMPHLLRHALVSFDANDVMTFLGRKLTPYFKGEVVSDLREFQLRGRPPGRRIKHRMKGNWIKMYDKAGSVLRVETVINQPEEFRVRRRVRRNGKRVTEWVPLRKSVALLFRYRDVARAANARYLDALSKVADPTSALRQLEKLTTRRETPAGRTVKPFNPLATGERDLFRSLLGGEHLIHGFTNRDLRAKLLALGVALPTEPRRQAAWVSRQLTRLHVHGLIAKVPRARRWRVSAAGYRTLSAAVTIHDVDFAKAHSEVTPVKAAA